MTHRELREVLCELVETFFGSTNIVWGMTGNVNPNNPLVSLVLGDINRPYHPIKQTVNGVPTASYPSVTMLQIDLFTNGAKTTEETNVTATMENTAVSDLTDFVNFLGSDYVDDWTGLRDVSILANYPVRDLTAVTNKTSWDFRAMVELEIRFTQTAVGHAATMHEGGLPFHSNGTPMFDAEGYALDRNGNRLPGPPLPFGPDGKPIYPPAEQNPSGGITQELADKSTGWFEQVDGPHYEKEEPSNGKQS
jgi:hypothetical protein